MKKIIFSFILLICILSGCGILDKKQSSNKNIKKYQIVTTLPPIASIANYIGGEFTDVSSIVQPGFSVHTFDLKPSDVIKINKANLVISTGLPIDSFFGKILKNQNSLILNNYVDLIESDEHNHQDKNTEKYKEENNNEKNNIKNSSHNEIFYDSHIWLSLENGNKIAEAIKNKLIIFNPENKDIFNKNYKDFLIKSENIKNSFLNRINNKSQLNFIVFHNAYTYMFHELHINENRILHLQENEGREPSVSEMKIIIDSIEKNNIKILFKEPQFETKLIKNISKKYNLKVLNLDPLGISIGRSGYFENIENNLNNLLEIYE